MNPILQLIEKTTGGKPYRSHRFCFDAELKLPSLAYDDDQKFSLEKELCETDASLKTTKSVASLAKKIAGEKPLFTFFLDGSRRVYKVDDIEFAQRLFPMIGGQIGVGCCERADAATFRKAILEKHYILSLPTIAGTEGGTRQDLFFGRLIDEINKLAKLERFGIKFDRILLYNSNRPEAGKPEVNYMDKGTAVIQDKMIELEKKIVDDLVRQNRLNQDNYLLKDGSLQYQQIRTGDFREIARVRSNFRRVVGASKSFNPEFSRDRRGRSNAANIANLKLYHRTPAAMYSSSHTGEVKYSIWYLRIREAERTESPFAGVLKLEKILMTGDETERGLDSHEIDLISANIVNERNPVCYGNDQRWANHLYPIYLTENYIKSQYISDLHFLNLF